MPLTERLELLHEVRRTARAAAAEILDVYARDFEVELKRDSSPLTEADRRAHAVIVNALSALDPGWPVLSEESGDSEHDGRREWRRFWLVDPLDGTKEFVKRNGEFTVNIALIEDGLPTLGVVLAPALGREFCGLAGTGAWRSSNADHELEPIRTAPAPAGPVRVVGSRSHAAGGALDTYIAALGDHVLRPIGSSLKICLVAEGEADVYPRFGPTSEWDTAAAQAVLESAGGCIIDLDGRPLRYNRGDNLLNPYFLAVGDPSRDWLAPLRHG